MKNKRLASAKKPQAKNKNGSSKMRRVAHAAAPTRAKRSAAAAAPVARRLTAGGAARKRGKKADKMMTGAVAMARKLQRAARSAQPKGNGANPATTAGAPARYGQAMYGQAFYVTDDPVPVPVPGKAKPSLGLARRADSDLVGFGHNVDEAMDANARFPDPQPSKAVYDADLAAFETIVTAMENHRLEGLALTEQRNLLRAKFSQTLGLRADYVTLVSQGDGEWIQSAGMPLRNVPSPVGTLPPPLNLRTDRTNLDNELLIRWNAVVEAKGGYMLEMAEVVNNVATDWKLIYMGGKPTHLQTSGMETGKTYAFRVAAVGGQGGKSAFSPEVWRTAA